MVKIRLKRIGNKFNAIYRIVVADAKAPRDGKFIEELKNILLNFRGSKNQRIIDMKATRKNGNVILSELNN